MISDARHASEPRGRRGARHGLAACHQLLLVTLPKKEASAGTQTSRDASAIDGEITHLRARMQVGLPQRSPSSSDEPLIVVMVGLLATQATLAREPSPLPPEVLARETRLSRWWIGCV